MDAVRGIPSPHRARSPGRTQGVYPPDPASLHRCDGEGAVAKRRRVLAARRGGCGALHRPPAVSTERLSTDASSLYRLRREQSGTAMPVPTLHRLKSNLKLRYDELRCFCER